MMVLGIDPGFRNLGVCMYDTAKGVDSLDVFVTTKGRGPSYLDHQACAHDLAVFLAPLVRHADLVVTEAISIPRNARTAILLALTFGTLFSLAAVHGKEVRQVRPRDIKRLVHPATGKASKGDVEAFMADTYGTEYTEAVEHITPGKRNHAADALGAVLVALS